MIDWNTCVTTRSTRAPPGTPVYLKPILTARGQPVPYDVFSYGKAEPAFPHESTADQWFSESQSER